MSARSSIPGALIATLLDAEDDRILFVPAQGEPIRAADIRAGARQLVNDLPAADEAITVFSSSAATLAAACLAAQHLQRPLNLLPQAGASYCNSLGLDRQSFVGEFAGYGHVIDWSAEDDTGIALRRHEAFRPTLSFYTSGSTGQVKIIEKPLSVLEAEAAYWVDRLEGEFDWVCGSVSHQHIYGFIFRFLVPLLSGTPAADSAALSWEALFQRSGKRPMLVSSPAHLTRLAPEDTLAGFSPSIILSSGGPLPLDAALTARKIFGHSPIEILGSTETGGVAWRQRDGSDEHWTPLEDVNATQSDEGELIVSSPYIPEDEPVHMGDLAEFTADGRFLLKGRADLITKIEGKRVSLTRVTDALLGHPAIEDALALVTQHGARERLSAIVVPSEQGRRELIERGPFRFSRELAKDLAETLESAETPKRWRFVADIPLDSQSKRSRANLTNLFEGQRILELLKPDISHTGDYEAELLFTVTPDYPWFKGHFHDAPILPGLAQVHIAAAVCEEIWALRPASHAISRLKFNRIIQPGEDIRLVLKFNTTTRKLNFGFSCEGDHTSSGTIG
ncbi:ApeI family dehydratase [Henriciella litoralis]|uniref:ApeI family dehydratase n=1 Tax=Henriciella litoralis TaxID=568102 RepID=UPI000A05F2E7|nr:AMP-binding protein [Henriciella litoralis]